MWSYGGWDTVCQCYDEIQNPKRNMPIILIVSMMLVGALYVSVNVAYFTFEVENIHVLCTPVKLKFEARPNRRKRYYQVNFVGRGKFLKSY